MAHLHFLHFHARAFPIRVRADKKRAGDVTIPRPRRVIPVDGIRSA